MADVVILTMSGFGRAVAENGNRGTDHGHGNAMMVIGGGVRGGKVYGKWPGLAREQRYEGRDLAVTTDFRTSSPKSPAAPRRDQREARVPGIQRACGGGHARMNARNRDQGNQRARERNRASSGPKCEGIA